MWRWVVLIFYFSLSKLIIFTEVNPICFYKVQFIKPFYFHNVRIRLLSAHSCKFIPLIIYFFVLKSHFILTNLFSCSFKFQPLFEGVNFIFLPIQSALKVQDFFLLIFLIRIFSFQETIKHHSFKDSSC